MSAYVVELQMLRWSLPECKTKPTSQLMTASSA